MVVLGHVENSKSTFWDLRLPQNLKYNPKIMMQGILSLWEKSILEVFGLYIIQIYIYHNMRCILKGILVYFQSLGSSFDTILTFNYLIGHCCKSFQKVVNFIKMMTQEPKNAQNVCEKHCNASIYLVAWMPCWFRKVKIEKTWFFGFLKKNCYFFWKKSKISKKNYHLFNFHRNFSGIVF
jgi:hypothetical protein